MTTKYNTTIKQPTGVTVFYRVPSLDAKKPKPILRSIYADTLDVEEAEKEVMSHLHDTKEVFLEPILILVQGGKA